jgi:hypothetical protein
MSSSIEILERTRANILKLIEEAAADVERERLQLEQQAGAAIEHATSLASTADAYKQGRMDERMRIQVLINAQRQMLGRGGVNAISLETLSRMIEE